MQARVLAEDEMRCDLWRSGSGYQADEHAADPSQRAVRRIDVGALSRLLRSGRRNCDTQTV